MSKLARKARRSEHYEVSEGWAVSYSDLLMVLMSFFIIYFNLNTEKENVKIEQLAFKLINNEILQKQNVTISTNRKIANNDLVEGLNPLFKEGKGEQKQVYKEFLIDLPPNIYEVGKYDLSHSVTSKLEKVFDVIREHKKDVDVYFIGHTDVLKFKKNKDVINSNLVLSSMRAVKAVEYAIKKGFDENQVFVQGLKGQPRNTRSLSLRLVSR